MFILRVSQVAILSVTSSGSGRELQCERNFSMMAEVTARVLFKLIRAA